jgi:hypothetical protein
MKIKQLLAILILPFVFASCVSKKKYQEQIKLADERFDEKAVLEEVLTKMAVANDSLTNIVELLDSLYRLEKLKNANPVANNTVKNGGGDRSLKFKVKPKLIDEKEEYDTKAVFIYNFISYIFWPMETLTESFNIAIVGDSPIKGYLQSRSSGRNVNNYPITIEAYNPKKNYHIIFFSKSGEGNFMKIKKTLNSKNVLLITENQLFESIGSHITLLVDGRKIKFSANKNEIEKTKLKVNSSFYRLSE